MDAESWNTESWLGLPAAAAQHAAEIDRVLVWSHLLILGLLAVWGGVFTIALLRASRRSSEDRRAGWKATRWPFLMEGAVVAAEALLVFGLSIPLARGLLSEPPPGETADGLKPLEVRVVGQQYAWNFHYAGADGAFAATDPERVDDATNALGIDFDDPRAADDAVALGRLRLPVGRPVVLRLTSRDVIHGFAVPHLRLQRDAVPGTVATLRFTPTVTTEQMRRRSGDDTFELEIVCGQLCGLGHFRMRGFVEVLTPEAFDTWLGEQALGQVDDFWS